MAQVINTNVTALFGAQALNKSKLALDKAMQRLSSGVRINSAKDDPTGLGLAVNIDAQVRGANMAALGSANAVTAAQTNDGYLQQITDNTQRLREIAVQLGGTAAGSEATALIAENTRIKALMNAATSSVVVDTAGTTQATTGTKLGASAGTTVANYDTDLTSINTARAAYGADMATFQSVTNNLQLQSVNLSNQYSRIMDTDYAAETQNMTRNQILQQAGTAMLAQANQLPNSVLSLLR